MGNTCQEDQMLDKPTSIKVYRFPDSQRGAALLVFVLLVLAGSAYVLLTGLNEQRTDQLNLNKTQRALSEAKEALIASAVTYYESNLGEFGFLPCPDVNGGISPEGAQDPNCGPTDVNSLGRLPWRSIGTLPLTDGNGECLWYAVSGYYKANPKIGLLNEDSNGTFQIFAEDGVTFVAGNSPENRPVAVIIAPGATNSGQDRSEVPGPGETVEHCKGNYNPVNYLETLSGIDNASLVGAADSIDQFITARVTNDNTDIFNDVVAYITKDEIYDAVKRRNDFAGKLHDNNTANNLTRKVTECLARYSARNATNHFDIDGDGDLNQSLPWPAPLDLDDYRDDDDYDDRDSSGTILAGRLPIDIEDSNDEIYDGCGAPQTCDRPDDDLLEFCDDFWVDDAGLTQAQSDELQALWQNWKDHLFYVVSQQFQPKPMAQDTGVCGNGQFCVTTDDFYPAGSQDWAAIVFYSNTVITAQSRDAPPIDVDERNNIANYLEDENTGLYVDGDGNQYYKNAVTSATFNDILYCINDHDGSDGIAAFSAGRCP